jgi:hypothetical protein
VNYITQNPNYINVLNGRLNNLTMFFVYLFRNVIIRNGMLYYNKMKMRMIQNKEIKQKSLGKQKLTIFKDPYGIN